MADLGGRFGAGFSSGVDQGIKNRALGQRQDSIDKAKAFKENMKVVSDFASVWQFAEGEVADLNDPQVKKRMTNELILQFSDLSGGKVSPRAKAMINVLVDKELGEAKALSASMLKSAGQGGFNMRTFVNAANTDKPGVVKAYLDQTLGADKRASEVQKNKAQANKAQSEADFNKLKNALITNAMKKRKAREQTAGVAPAISSNLQTAEDFAIALPSSSRALRGVEAEKRLQPAGVIKTAQAKASAKNISEVPKADLVFLGIDPRKPETPASLANRGIRIPSVPEKARLLKIEAGTKKAHSIIQSIVTRVENRPELLSAPGFISKTFANLTSIIEGSAKLLGGDLFEPAAARGFLESLPVLGNLGRTSRESAILKSQLIDLTFKVGSLINMSGGKKFTNQDFNNIATQLAAGTADPSIMVGVLRTFAIVNNNAFNDEFETFTGTRKFVGLTKGINVKRPFADLTDKELSGVMTEVLNGRQLNMYEADILRRMERIGRGTFD